MALAEHLPEATRHGPRCTVSLARADLDDEADRLTLDAWLVDRTITSARIAAALRAFPGVTEAPSRNTIDRHRRQECRCDQ